METLVPFDFEKFKADPTRLRLPGGDPSCIIRAEPVLGNCVAVLYKTCGAVYSPDEFYRLRLAVKTRKIKLRLIRENNGTVSCTTSDHCSISTPVYCNLRPWIGEAWEVEVPDA
jgi:hypothetical protein